MAGGSLVFAKAIVKLISGSLNHTNEGNQFVHPAAIFTILLLALSAVFQIICLNRGLKVYDSTLVVPTFYAVYTASGFLNSLIFMDEVDAYKPWTLFAVFVSIGVLISGVVLLTNKKPETKPTTNSNNPTMLGPVPRSARRAAKIRSTNDDDDDDEHAQGDEEDDALRLSDDDDAERDAVVWQIGAEEEEEEGEEHRVGMSVPKDAASSSSKLDLDAKVPRPLSGPPVYAHDEQRGLMGEDDPSGSGDPFADSQSKAPEPGIETPTLHGAGNGGEDDEFGEFEEWDRTSVLEQQR